MKKFRKKYDDLTESQKQRVNQKIVDRCVYTCQSEVVEFVLAKAEDTREYPFCWDDVENRYVSFEQAKKQGIISEDCEEDDYEYEPQEVFEWWFVDHWLLGKLSALGEPCIPDFGIWGRCTTGQSITIDSVIYTIAKELWDEGYFFEDSDFEESFFVSPLVVAEAHMRIVNQVFSDLKEVVEKDDVVIKYENKTE